MERERGLLYSQILVIRFAFTYCIFIFTVTTFFIFFPFSFLILSLQDSDGVSFLVTRKSCGPWLKLTVPALPCAFFNFLGLFFCLLPMIGDIMVSKGINVIWEKCICSTGCS